jgi:hypothetical protein
MDDWEENKTPIQCGLFWQRPFGQSINSHNFSNQIKDHRLRLKKNIILDRTSLKGTQLLFFLFKKCT